MSDSDAAGSERSANAVPEPAPAAAPPASEEPQPRRRSFAAAIGIFVLLLLAATGGGLIVITWPWLNGGGMGGAGTERLSALEHRVDQISASQVPKTAGAGSDEVQRNLAALKARIDTDDARLSTLESSGPAAAGEGVAPLKAALDKNTSDLAALRSDFDTRMTARGEALDKLDGRIAALEKNAPPADLAEQLNSFALKSGVAALEARIGRLEEQDTAGLMRRAASMLAVADLVRATSREQPFDNELNALKALMPASPELADLSKYARKGAPTVASLAAQFHQNIDSVLAAERASRAKNWIEAVWYDFVNLVSVRRVGNVAGSDTEARLARAEFALKNEDLAAAVTEARALDKPARVAIASWLARAEARLAVDRDTHALTNRIVAALAAAGDAAKIAPQPPSDAAK